MHDEDVEPDDRDRRLDHDLRGLEPVEAFSARQHELQKAHADDESEEAGPRHRSFVLRGVGHQDPGCGEDGGAHRNRQVEDPRPAELLHDDAGGGGREDVGADEAERPQRGRLHVALLGEGVDRDDLPERQERRPEEALHEAPRHLLLQGGRGAAADEGDHVAHDRPQEDRPAPETVAHPADGGGHRGAADDERDHHPRDLTRGGREAPLHVGQGHRHRVPGERVDRGREGCAQDGEDLPGRKRRHAMHPRHDGIRHSGGAGVFVISCHTRLDTSGRHSHRYGSHGRLDAGPPRSGAP